MLILAGDIGGTKTALQLAEVEEGGSVRPLAERRYESAQYPDLELIVEDFLTGEGAARNPPTTACFAVAGPVRGQRARITNLPWTLDAELMQQRLGIANVMLINDFQGVGYGVPALGPEGVLVLQGGEPVPGGTRALLGAGTGLGQALLVWTGERYRVLGTEGGHVDFAPRDAVELELLEYLLRSHHRVSYETLLSGRGLVRIYEFLRDSGRGKPGTDLARALPGGDPAAIISEHALTGRDPLALQALQRFVSIYGAQAGNLALNCLPTGGLYIGGGIAPKILPALDDGRFMEAFRAKSPMAEVLASIPVSVVLDERVGLLGAREVAKQLVELPYP